MVRLTTCFEIKIIIQTLDLNINYSSYLREKRKKNRSFFNVKK